MATKDESSLAQPASAASQRADTQALVELNQRSAPLGVWDVGIFRPVMHRYTYT